MLSIFWHIKFLSYCVILFFLLIIYQVNLMTTTTRRHKYAYDVMDDVFILVIKTSILLFPIFIQSIYSNIKLERCIVAGNWVNGALALWQVLARISWWDWRRTCWAGLVTLTEWVMKYWQKRFETEKWAVREVGGDRGWPSKTKYRRY